MKAMLLITFLSVVTATIFMSGGYGIWKEELTIEGSVEVYVPESESNSGTIVNNIINTDDNQAPESLQNLDTERYIQGTETSSFGDGTSTTDNSSFLNNVTDILQSTDTKENTPIQDHIVPNQSKTVSNNIESNNTN